MQLATNEQLVASTSSTPMQSNAVSKTPEELANIVTLFVSSEGWIDRVRLRARGRWYERLHLGPDHDIWVISWLPGNPLASTTTVSPQEPSS
jgi:hypothetical protein